MSRSAAAADKLEKAGYENIACIVSGLQKVKPGSDSLGFATGFHVCHRDKMTTDILDPCRNI